MDDVDHTLFAGPHWSDLRNPVSAALGRPVTASDVDPMLCGDGTALDAWVVKRRILLDMIEAIMDKKEQEERERQQEQPIDGGETTPSQP